MLLAALALLLGFILLVWSADRFVDGAAATATHLGLPSLLIGMVIVGFGTSAPEMVVSGMAALDGNPQLALGNGLGSNIVNISLVLGFTAMLMPLDVHSKIVRKELPIALSLGVLVGYFLWNNALDITESWILLSGFFVLIGWSIYTSLTAPPDALDSEMAEEVASHNMPLSRALMWLAVGLILLIGSSRLLVWGAVEIAHAFGVSDLIIGLTIVALGTSLPELAATISAAKKGEHDIAIGNVVGSNMFNLLAVIGIAGVIHPMENIDGEVMLRDFPTMFGLTLALFIMGIGLKNKQGRINRLEGGILFAVYIGYNLLLAKQSFAG